MTRAQRLRAIRVLYAELPELKCKGLCSGACGPIACSLLERDVIEKRAGKPLRIGVHPALGPGTCSMLAPTGRCTVYGDRPLICRLYGLADGLWCEHGCEPSRVLSKDEARDLIARINELGGRPDLDDLARQMTACLEASA
jgi:Fe-S-cluster containining protein